MFAPSAGSASSPWRPRAADAGPRAAFNARAIKITTLKKTT